MKFHNIFNVFVEIFFVLLPFYDLAAKAARVGGAQIQCAANIARDDTLYVW